MLQCLQPAKGVTQQSKQKLGRYWRAVRLLWFVIQIIALGWSWHVLAGMSRPPHVLNFAGRCSFLWQALTVLADAYCHKKFIHFIAKASATGQNWIEILAWTTHIKHDLHLHVPCSLARSQRACSLKLAFHPLEWRSNVSKRAQKLSSNLMASTCHAAHHGLKSVGQMNTRPVDPAYTHCYIDLMGHSDLCGFVMVPKHNLLLDASTDAAKAPSDVIICSRAMLVVAGFKGSQRICSQSPALAEFLAASWGRHGISKEMKLTSLFLHLQKFTGPFMRDCTVRCQASSASHAYKHNWSRRSAVKAFGMPCLFCFKASVIRSVWKRVSYLLWW